MASNKHHEFVILGGQFAGLSIAHYLMKHTIPYLSKIDFSIAYHVTIVTPSTHFYWKIGAPRVLVSPDLIPVSKVFAPIANGLKEYPNELYTLVYGTAVGLEPEKRVVTVQLVSEGTETLSYSTLIVATGTTAPTGLWTINGSHENTINALKEMQRSLPFAKTILLAGGGPAGTETAGEIASQYPNAKFTMLSGGTRLLERLLPSTGKDAEARLKKLGVEVIHNVRVISVKRGGNGGPTELGLNDGSTRTIDVYIDSTGGKLNTSFLPQSWLNAKGQVLNDIKTLRSKSPVPDNVYAIGDAGSYSQGGVMDVKSSIAPLGSTIAIDLAAKISSSTGGKFKQQIFKPMTDTQIVPIGPKGGVGQLFGYRIPSLMVWGIKGRNYMVDSLKDWVDGSQFLKP